MFQNVMRMASLAMVLALSPALSRAWTNGDFETGDFTGWTASTQSHCGVPAACPITRVVSPTTAVNADTLDTVHGGSYGAMIYSGYADDHHYDFARLEQSDVVPAGAPCISLWLAAVLNGYHYGGTYGDDTYVLFEILVNGSAFYTRRYSWEDNNSQLIDDGHTAAYWKTLPWTRYYYDLSPYVGQTITVRLTAYNCDESMHNSYGYLDDLAWVPLSAMPTLTPTVTPTPEATATPSATPTGTVPPIPPGTPATLGGIHLWPNPLDPVTAVDGALKCENMPTGSTLVLYTVSGEKIVELPEHAHEVSWKAVTASGKPLAPGVYYYAVQSGGGVEAKGTWMVR